MRILGGSDNWSVAVEVCNEFSVYDDIVEVALTWGFLNPESEPLEHLECQLVRFGPDCDHGRAELLQNFAVNIIHSILHYRRNGGLIEPLLELHVLI